jgi:hypothetical protein
MKSNTPPNVAYRILSPAVLEIVLIFICISLSAACLIYELYLKWFKKSFQSNQTTITPSKSIIVYETDMYIDGQPENSKPTLDIIYIS